MIKTTATIHLRWMIQRDMPEVLIIENLSYPSPWTEEDFRHSLKQRNCIGLLAEMGGEVVGYAVYEFHKSRYVITNLAVHPDFRRHGVATALIEKLKTKMMNTKPKISLDLRESNLAAQCLFRSAGFKARKVIRKYYEDTGEDAYFMEFRKKVF